MRRLIFLILLMTMAFPAMSRGADTWTYAASDHFEVYTTANAGTAREALKYFESVHTFFAVTFPSQRPELKNRTRLIIFSNDRQFAPYRPNESAAAFYQSGAERDYIVMKGFDEAANQIVVHEYVHLFLRHSGGRYPVWLNEGLAEFFSTMTPERGRMVIGGVPPGRGMYLAESPMLPIRRLFNVKHDSPEYNTRSHSGVFYAQSWLLTHMIMVGDEFYRKGQDTFLTLTARGVPAEEAMMQVYSRTPEQVEGDLRRYLNAQLRVYRPAYKEPPAVKYETRVVDAFEAELVTAHLFANRLEGEGAARAAFTKLEQQRPNDVPLLEARGYFELRRGNREVATSYFERAVEHGSRNIGLYRDYMRLDASKSAVLLPKALAIAPDDPDIRIEQAAVLMRERKGSQAVLALRDVL